MFERKNALKSVRWYGPYCNGNAEIFILSKTHKVGNGLQVNKGFYLGLNFKGKSIKMYIVDVYGGYQHNPYVFFN